VYIFAIFFVFTINNHNSLLRYAIDVCERFLYVVHANSLSLSLSLSFSLPDVTNAA